MDEAANERSLFLFTEVERVDEWANGMLVGYDLILHAEVPIRTNVN